MVMEWISGGNWTKFEQQGATLKWGQTAGWGNEYMSDTTRYIEVSFAHPTYAWSYTSLYKEKEQA